jgi:hypothetical protein
MNRRGTRWIEEENDTEIILHNKRKNIKEQQKGRQRR